MTLTLPGQAPAPTSPLCRLHLREHDVFGRQIIAFSGSRMWPNEWGDRAIKVIEQAILRLLDQHGRDRLHFAVGDARRGVDPWAQDALDFLGMCWRLEIAHWKVPVPGGAGHERNGRVLAGASMLIAIRAPGPWTPGTRDAIRQAERFGIKVHEWHEGRWKR